MKTLLLIPLCLVSCTLPDVLARIEYQPGLLSPKGKPVLSSIDIASSGGSIFTKTKREAHALQHKGSVIRSSSQNKDELGVVRVPAQAGAVGAFAPAVGAIGKEAVKSIR